MWSRYQRMLMYRPNHILLLPRYNLHRNTHEHLRQHNYQWQMVLAGGLRHGLRVETHANK